MKCIKVRIDQLGRIRDSEILVSPLMVFSGESGLGKSYLALLCHYFFELLINTSRLNHFFVDNNIDFNILSKDFKDVGTALEIKKQDLEAWMAKDAILYLRYMLGYDGISGQIEITLPESVPDTMAFTYKNELTGLVDKEEIYTILSLGNLRFRIQEKTQFDESPFAFLLRFVLIDYIFGNYQKLDSTFVLPPSRGPILTEQIIPTTGMYSEFLNDMAGLNRIKPRPDTASEIVLKLFRTILEGEVDKEETTYIYTTNDASMPVSAAAASIREIAPLQILAKKQDVSRCAILVEEPEAHLHPLKQRMMADIIGALSHNGAIMQITTHSDYFLRRLNELIMFAKAKKTTDDPDKLRTLSEKVNIVEDMSIDESIIGAYLLRKQADNTSIAVKQDISNGIPFAAFRDAILDNMNYQDILGDYLQDVTE
ncbi:AAA family ATPase [Prevotella copri]|uniref:AAA family ATPase n=1 Tax=Segatella copri TaxID=165179 RepID=A0A646HMY8_9BACT|nr:AAA family ATPase [Segatella copri]MQN89324.1 AAA family ATPase [Segatella copri]MQO79006.1 AAA family ATPase [Segatella copri]